MSSNSQSYSYSYYSSSTSSNGGPPQTTAYAERSYTDKDGTTTERLRKLPGQQPVYESAGRAGDNHVEGRASGSQNRITDVTDVDRQYLERMGEEYAKREGGA
ncbi:hypothetical protein F5B22DRAFT_592617 [Xylaria bambusicola]|uniref:uncharacterized protein n=1 Tax=Xylaria bambusicola TaxID=326684 RepID=UPI002008ADC8|nr:uncharacterized protein F5B22DRAFT_592617 [Xylaria bambusicola]KAI0522042.1 hypothetical protein F5B22DRAFT_592617 [Xylaria bambusicola]